MFVGLKPLRLETVTDSMTHSLFFVAWLQHAACYVLRNLGCFQHFPEDDIAQADIYGRPEGMCRRGTFLATRFRSFWPMQSYTLCPALEDITSRVLSPDLMHQPSCGLPAAQPPQL